MKKILLIAGIAIGILSCGSSQQKTSKIVDFKTVDPTQFGNTITSAELKEMLYTYASDEFEGRETGEPGQKKAINYIKDHYVEMGIPSALPNNNYFQEVPLEKQKIPDVKLTVDGKSIPMLEEFIVTGSVNSENISTNEIIYAGFGIDTDNYSDYKNLDVKGKIVFVKAGEPKNEDGTYVTTGKTEDTQWSSGRRARSAKSTVAKEKGAKGFIILDNAAFDYYSKYYSRMAENDTAGRISLVSNEKDMFNLLINDVFAKKLLSNIDTNDTPQIISKKIDLSITKNAEMLSSENVAAFMKGSEFPDEILVISAHLDHEGVKDGKVYNGADDDGSGTVAILEIAEAFKAASKKGFTPRRSILFLHVTGEEKGLLGSRHYTDNDPIFPLANTVADLNIDMIGRVDKLHEEDRNYVYIIGSDMLSSELHQVSETTNAKYSNIKLDYKYNNDTDPNRYYYRSDHYNFAKNNVPVIFYYNGTHDDYHKPTDTPDKIEYDLLEARTRLIFYTAWEIANRDKKLTVDKLEVTPTE